MQIQKVVCLPVTFKVIPLDHYQLQGILVSILNYNSKKNKNEKTSNINYCRDFCFLFQ